MPGTGAWTRRDVAWCVGLFAGGLALRLAHLVTIRDASFFTELVLDPRFYDEWGMRIAAGDWLGDRPYFQDPLYPYFLAVLYAAFGHHHEVVVVVQSVLGALVAPLLFLASRPWFDASSARLTGAIAALYLPSIFYEGLILKTCLTVFLMSCALWALSRALSGRSRWAWLASGAWVGLAGLTRGNLILFVPVLVAWVLLARETAPLPAAPGRGPLGALLLRLARRPAREAAALVVLGSCLVLAPAALRNRWVGGEWILTTSNAGQNFYIGNNPHNTDGEYALLPFVDPDPEHEETDFAREAERRAGRRLRPAEVSRFWFAEAVAWMRSHPGDASWLTWRKLRNYWGAYEIPDNVDYAFARESAPVLRLPIPGFGVVAPLGIVGAGLAARRRGWPRALLLFLAVYSASVVLFFVFSRFRMPMMPALFVFAGSGAVELARLARGTVGWARRAAILGATVAAFAFVNLPVRGSAGSPALEVAERLGLPSRRETSATTHFNLGVSFAARAMETGPERDAWLRRAELELDEALRLGADYAKVHLERGKVLARQGREEEAIEAHREALRLEPGNYRAWHALGLLNRRTGRLADAEAAFRAALRLRPRHLASAVRLGEVLLQEGRRQEAAEAFQQALALDPVDPEARAGYARAVGP